MAQGFFQNLIRFHNLFAYKEIAAKLGVSAGRVNNVVMGIYEKLHIHGKRQLLDHVW